MNATTTAQKTAVAYYRTSSATNVGEDKDSQKRQEDAVRAYASANGLEIVREYYDAAVSGTDPVEARPGFSDMLAYMLGNGARIVLVETAGRFARHHIVQGLGHALLKKHGITLIPVDSPTHFTEDDPTANMMRTIIAAVSQFEKEALVLKLRKARDRVRAAKGRCEGNPAWVKGANKTIPEAVVQAARAARARKLSLRGISAELASKGFLNRSGKPYAAQSIKHMLAG